jgi:hypothetical protein
MASLGANWGNGGWGSSVLFRSLFFADFFEVLGEGNLETLLVVLIKAVFLESVQGDGGLQNILEIDKTEEVLAPAHGGLLDEADALEAREWSKDV